MPRTGVPAATAAKAAAVNSARVVESRDRSAWCATMLLIYEDGNLDERCHRARPGVRIGRQAIEVRPIRGVTVAIVTMMPS